MEQNQLKANYLFVAHSHGEMDGTSYDNVLVSNGIRVIKLKNLSGKIFDLSKGFIPEQTRVEVTLDISSKKEVAIVNLLDMVVAAKGK